MTQRPIRQYGYTLMELLLTVSIITLVTSIALPSYRNHVTRSHRGDAMSALMRIANAQEKFYLQNNTYAGTLAELNITTTAKDYYALSIDSADINAFSASATPTSGGPQDGDDACATFTIDSTGALGATTGGGADNTSFCWR